MTGYATPGLEERARQASVSFCERIEPAAERIEDLDSARLVTRIQAGDESAFAALYSRYFDRVYGYLRVALKDAHEAEDHAQQVFMKVLAAVPAYEIRRGKPFRAWLFRIARNEAISHLRRSNLVDVEAPEDIDRLRENELAEPEIHGLSGLTDADLVTVIQQLPEAQRQVLALRYMIGLSTEEIGLVLDKSIQAVGQLHYRARRFLETRLRALRNGEHRRRVPRSQMLVRLRRMPVLGARREALGPPMATPRYAASARISRRT
ncbi:MAG: polymerase sigma-70 factor, subfamily [Solirubrobacterales bacterium]|jgi:RNA polymerase sigma-70 factor (ECF subfamily)|nr:polymerase sigma-70 factor, subfamily [Solirubrobacterales bacterium]